MRFQPGEPNPQQRAIAQCEFESAQLLAYCSGNNLIILSNSELVQTLYLPKDGLALDIDAKSGDICVSLADSILVFGLKRSYSRGINWELDITLPVSSTICAWLDSHVLAVGTGSVQLINRESHIIWQEDVVSPVSDCLVSPDSQQFVLVSRQDTQTSLHPVWTRVSQSAFNFDFGFIRSPAAIVWSQWAGVLYFTWSSDAVLRGYKQLNSGIYEVVASLDLEKDTNPVIIQDKNLIFVLYSCQDLYSLVALEPVGTTPFIRPRQVWKNISAEISSLNPGTHSIADPTRVTAVHNNDKIEFLIQRRGEILRASVPKSVLESTPKVLETRLVDLYTGHLKSIKQISRSLDGYTLFTQSRFTENIIWKSRLLQNGETTLEKQAVVPVNNPSSADLWGDRLVTVSGTTLSLWDISTAPTATLQTEIPLKDKPLTISCTDYDSVYHVLAIYAENIKMWRYEKPGTLQPLRDSLLGATQSLNFATIVDPVGWVAVSHSRDILTTISGKEIQTWSLEIVDGKYPKWTETSSMTLDDDTVSIPAKIKMSSRKKLAVSQGNRLIIWDAQNDVAELDKTIENETVNDLDWTTTPTGDCLLGVGYSSRVVIYCQRRYDYTKKLEAWTPIRETDIKRYTEHQIGDSVWLKDGTFVIGAGNQLFIQAAAINVEDEKVRDLLRENNTISSLVKSSTIFDVNSVLSGPLPVYHPQFLIQLIFTDRVDLAGRILCRLLNRMKYSQIVEPYMVVVIDFWLGLDPENMNFEGNDASAEEVFDISVAEQLEEQLKRKALCYLTRHQQMTLLSVVQSIPKLNHSLDNNGVKFMLGQQLFRLHKSTQQAMNMRDFVWGSISDTKQVLLDEVEQVGATTTLEAFTQYGLMFWLEQNALLAKSEDLAKKMFATSRDPVKVSLLYLAMRKKSLLIGLWRLSSSHPEQSKTMKLLNNDFETKRWKEAALKNAYALMSKHRYEYAAALFLLGGACKDAVNILARQMNNLPLAFLVARLYEGDSGPAMEYLIDRFLCDDEQVAGDDIYSHKHWLRVWAYMTTGDFKNAVKCATTNRSGRASNTITDPVLIWIYKHLRKKSPLTSKEESRVLERTASVYCRMGCDLIALRASATWKFSQDPATVVPVASVNPSQDASAAPSDPPSEPKTGVEAPINPTPKLPEAVDAPQAAQFDLSAFGF